MELFYGNFNSLEQEFLHYLETQKTNPLDKILIITPSGRLGSYLRREITHSQGVISNIFFTNLSGLFFAVDRELGIDKKPLLKDKNLQDFIVKEILSSVNFKQANVKGFSQGIKATLRDMIDSGVDAKTVADSAEEGLFGSKEDNSYILWLNQIYLAYIEQTAKVEGFRSYKQFFEDVLAQIPKSTYLAGFKKIIFYGFYDFTGLQLDSFSSVVDNHKTAVFFPYIKEKQSYKFCEKLFNSNILSKAKTSKNLEPNYDNLALDSCISNLFSIENSDDKAKQKASKNIEVINVSGVKDEINSACKKVLELVETKNYNFQDIAVIAHSLGEYKNDIFTIFSQNKIPINCILKDNLAMHPLGSFVLSILKLSENNFSKEDILSVIQSSYFKNKNKWVSIISQSCVNYGIANWQDIDDKQFVLWLQNLKKKLTALSKPESWEQKSEKAMNVLKDNINFEAFSVAEQEIWEKVETSLLEIKDYAKIRKEAKENEFLQELEYRLKNTQISFVSSADNGVQVLDVLSSRGMQFKAVILLGLNEKSFPVLVKEDPFLQDKYRRTLRDSLGFWVTEKLDRYLEEKLLFALSISCQEKLVCIYQRSSIDGKSLTFSTYLLELARACGVKLEDITAKIPRRNLEKYSFYPKNLLNKKEILLKSSTLQDAKQKFEELGIMDDSFKQKFNLSSEISQYFSPLSKYDGQVRDMSEAFEKINTKGFSASAMEEISSCPMKFFLNRILKIKDFDNPLQKDELAPNHIGTIYHTILKSFYEEIFVNKLFDELLNNKYQTILQKHIDVELNKDIAKKFAIYPVLWKAIAGKMEENIKTFVAKDIETNLKNNKFSPTEFELDIFSESKMLEGINWRGIVDRVDISKETKEFRVIDYKKSKKGSLRNIFKSNILQPVIYKELCENVLGENYKFTETSFLNIEKGSFKQSFSADVYTVLQDKIKSYLGMLLEYIKEGKFFITPSLACRYCDFSSICRKNSSATLARTKKSILFKQLEGYKE